MGQQQMLVNIKFARHDGGRQQSTVWQLTCSSFGVIFSIWMSAVVQFSGISMKLSLPPFLLGRRFRCRHCCSGDRRLLVRAVCSVTTTDDDLGQTAAAALAGAVVGRRYTGTRKSQKFAWGVGRGTIYGNRSSIPVSIHFAVFEKMCALSSPTSAGTDGQDKLKFNSQAQHVLARIVLDTIDECTFS